MAKRVWPSYVGCPAVGSRLWAVCVCVNSMSEWDSGLWATRQVAASPSSDYDFI